MSAIVVLTNILVPFLIILVAISASRKRATSQNENSRTRHLPPRPTMPSASLHQPISTTMPNHSTTFSNNDDLYAGSMNYVSTEGVCLDHEDQHDRPLPPAQPTDPESVVPGLDLAMDSPSLIGYVIFSEILGQPVSRRAPRFAK